MADLNLLEKGQVFLEEGDSPAGTLTDVYTGRNGYRTLAEFVVCNQKSKQDVRDELALADEDPDPVDLNERLKASFWIAVAPEGVEPDDDDPHREQYYYFEGQIGPHNTFTSRTYTINERDVVRARCGANSKISVTVAPAEVEPLLN